MTATMQKMMEWQADTAANVQETIIGAKIAWRQISEEKGRGVFALRNIQKDEIIEISPVVTVPASSIPDDGEAPDGYVLDWDPETEGEEHAMPLGYIMMYNHSANPNMRLENDMEEYTITAIAIRDIKAGEELTWDYACELWFDEE
jgi:SET domain-containing protein